MTGFTKLTLETQWGEIRWEARSLNHRGLDLALRFPDSLSSIEAYSRRMLSAKFNRGRIDVTLTLSRYADDSNNRTLDVAAVSGLMKHENSVLLRSPQSPPLSVADILKWPGVLVPSATDDSKLDEVVMDSFQTLLEDLEQDRLREGQQLQDLILEKINEMKEYENQLHELVADAKADARARFSRKLSELETEVDADRLDQEIVIALMKMDVSEEVDRFHLHVVELERVLLEEDIAGKRLGFLIQELSREVNTLSAKSAFYPLNSLLVDLKVVLEQIREQIQNIA